MLTKQLDHILQGLQSPGNFYVTGTLELFPPCLEVDQVGRISLPLLPTQAEQLIEVAERAPYGKGHETLVDTDVRRTWQINADKVKISGKYWQKNLADIVSQVKSGLGVDCDISAELYKLLVYDTGSFFVPHRDTEKADGMFATLVIVLPSLYSGGELVVSHKQETVKLDLHSQQDEEVSFAAFYADCVHEVLPINDGCRLTLIYNLIRSDKKIPLPTPPEYFHAEKRIVALLNHWAQSLNEKNAKNEIPEKLIFLLEHEYSIAELKFNALKNRDAASAEVLITAAKQAGCELYLALASIEESGSAEHTGYEYGDNWGNDYEVGEVFDHSETLSKWRSPDGGMVKLPDLPFYEEEFCPPEDFERMDPDDIEFQEATGNAGASFERMYHCAAIVLWPRAQYLAIISQAGSRATIPVLIELCQQWESTHKDSVKQDAQTLVTYILKDWIPDHCAQEGSYGRRLYTTDFLNCLFLLADTDLIKQFYSIVATTGIYHKQDSVALAQVAELLPWSDVVVYSTKAITVSAVKAPAACSCLLISLCNTHEQEDRQQLITAAQRLFITLPGDPERFPDQPAWRHKRLNLSSDEMADMIAAFSMIDTDLAEKTLDYMLAWPNPYDMDKVLLPIALHLAAATLSYESSAIKRLHQLVITHLQTRLAKQLEPPADWSREHTLGCGCKDCQALSVFLKSPDQEQWRFKAAEAYRKHLEHSITRNQYDVSFVTDKKNRPYSLVCTKNQASYLRRVEAAKNDQDALARLLAVG